MKRKHCILVVLTLAAALALTGCSEADKVNYFERCEEGADE